MYTINLIKSFLTWLRSTFHIEEVPIDASDLPEEPVKPVEESPVESSPNPHLLFDTPKNAFHSVRVACDDMNLTLAQKNIICACIYQESRFNNKAIGKNKNSTDWGIVQVNDTKGWHIGKGLKFPSVQYVIDNPEECVKWMIQMYRKGQLNLWASYSSGAYRQWIRPTSPMWLLK